MKGVASLEEGIPIDALPVLDLVLMAVEQMRLQDREFDAADLLRRVRCAVRELGIDNGLASKVEAYTAAEEAANVKWRH